MSLESIGVLLLGFSCGLPRRTAMMPDRCDFIFQLSRLPPGVKVMQRTVAAADAKPVGSRDGGGDVNFGFAHGSLQRQALGEAGGDGGCEGAAGGVGGFGGDARG